jgi:hypothetical protein
MHTVMVFMEPELDTDMVAALTCVLTGSTSVENRFPRLETESVETRMVAVQAVAGYGPV